VPTIVTERTYTVASYPVGKRRALLLNPPVYDTQYWAHWSQPAGLLRIATLLRAKGYGLDLIDCMATNAIGMVPKRKRMQGSKQQTVRRGDIEKPIYHFGSPLEDLEARMRALPESPNEVWVTSIMTYWWQSTRDVVNLARRMFPRATILVGGIYPTLASEHACENLSNADIIFQGEISEASNLPTDLSLYTTSPTYAILTTSRGCPWDCVYCAARALNGGPQLRQRRIDDVLDEIRNKRKHLGIRRFGFYEDNALIAKDNHFEHLMEAIIESGLKLQLYAPEGMETRLLTRDVLFKMRQAGFDKVHLPLETVKSDNNRKWNRRHSSVQTFEAALANAIDAGFRPRTTDINAFVLFGLPDERIDEVVDSMLYAHALVGSIIPMLFTPVPGTPVFRQHESYLNSEMGFDLHDLNGKFLPFLEYNQVANPGLRGTDYLQLEGLMTILNQGKVLSKAINLCDETGPSAGFRNALLEHSAVPV